MEKKSDMDLPLGIQQKDDKIIKSNKKKINRKKKSMRGSENEVQKGCEFC